MPGKPVDTTVRLLMTNSLKLLLFALESFPTDQIDMLLSIADKAGLPLSELIARSLTEMLASLPEAGRLDAIQQFKEMGINVENIFQ